MAVDVALDVEQGVDALHGLETDRRQHRRRLALRGPARAASDVGQHEELPARMGPTCRFQDRPGLASGLVKLAISAIGVRLQDAGIPGQVALWMLTALIARVVEHRSRGGGAAEWPVVAHIDPAAGDVGFAPRQDRHRGVVAVQSLGGHDMGLHALEQRHQHRHAGADLVGQRGQAERHALTAVALGLAIERLMLAELLEQDHRQQARAGPAARDHMERRRGLADALAVAARELLAHLLDNFPLAGDGLEGLGDVLPELGQPGAAAAGAGYWT